MVVVAGTGGSELPWKLRSKQFVVRDQASCGEERSLNGHTGWNLYDLCGDVLRALVQEIRGSLTALGCTHWGVDG